MVPLTESVEMKTNHSPKTSDNDRFVSDSPDASSVQSGGALGPEVASSDPFPGTAEVHSSMHLSSENVALRYSSLSPEDTPLQPGGSFTEVDAAFQPGKTHPGSLSFENAPIQPSEPCSDDVPSEVHSETGASLLSFANAPIERSEPVPISLSFENAPVEPSELVPTSLSSVNAPAQPSELVPSPLNVPVQPNEPVLSPLSCDNAPVKFIDPSSEVQSCNPSSSEDAPLQPGGSSLVSSQISSSCVSAAGFVSSEDHPVVSGKSPGETSQGDCFSAVQQGHSPPDIASPKSFSNSCQEQLTARDDISMESTDSFEV